MKLVVTLVHNSRSRKAPSNGTPSHNGLHSPPETPQTSQSASSGQHPEGSSEDYITEACLNAFADQLRSAWVLRSFVIKPLDDPYRPTIVEIQVENSAFIFEGDWAKVTNLNTKMRKYQGHLMEPFERTWNVQFIFQRDCITRRYKRLAVFDMDSTLVQQEVIDEIARTLGVEDTVSAITTRAMNGELDFSQSLRARCALLRGVSSSVFEDVKKIITLTPGAQDLVRALKRLGFKTAVLSGGFTPVTSWQAQQLGLDYAFANHLVVSADGATLTGELEGQIVDGEKKKELVQQIAEREGIPMDQVLVVGDGANDLPMMGVAGFGVAFNAKPKVQAEAPARLNSDSLLDILYLMGFTKDEIDQLLM